MKIKLIKEAIAMFSLVAVSVCTFGLNVTVATDGAANTSLLRDTSGGATPIVKAKWEMNATRNAAGEYLGTDDATTAGAQFMPSGQYQVNKTITLCAVVTDPDGLADIDAVYADVFYPEGISLGDSHVPLSDQSGLGCGELMQEDTLTRLSLDDGYELFCSKVKNGNNNLPVFNTGYDYDEICNVDTGELMKLTAAVYCGDKTISYEDPSGNYKVWAVAQDKVGLQGTLENHFTYLPLTAFEKDFTAVSYGNVKLNTHKIISGDLTWDSGTGANPATVRNVGNTRLSLKVMQDDMDLGKTDDIYNVLYDGRVGSDVSFVNYRPYTYRLLPGPLDLSEKNEIDFSILISKFPPTHDGDCYTGTMTLIAVPAPHLTVCIN
ncbi:MAG: hypothetical protein KAQ87_01060 [Candidatus Pacebacteria bacterium]|nr:hypothetical protein [Candidatus Paceibacterota bacterium]